MFNIRKQVWIEFFGLIAIFISFCKAGETDKPLRVVALQIGKDVKLTCSGGIDGRKIKSTDMHWERPRGNIVGRGPELYLKNVQGKDVGEYICRSTGIVDIASTNYKVFNTVDQSALLIGEQDTPNIIILPPTPNNTISLYETQNLDIKCNVTNWPEPDYNVQWMKSDGYIISNNIRLFIESVSQKQDEGTYICVVSHKNQHRQIFNKQVHVTINKPIVTIQILAGEKLQINGMIHRRCVGFHLQNSTETFSYTWLDSQGRTISNTDTIQVPINDPTVFGSYECYFIAEKSRETFITKVNISAEEKLDTQSITYLITITPYPQKFRLNEKFSIRCQVTPMLKDTKYRWYKNEQLLKENQQTLLFDSFTRANLGVYKCKAKGMNERNMEVEFEAKSYQRLSVFVPIKVELIEGAGSQVAVILSRKKELHCDVSPDSGYSGQEVKWSFENKELSTQNSLDEYNIARVNGRLVSILVINKAQISNEGQYQCEVGGHTKAVNIVVIQDDGLLIISPAIQRRVENQPAEFHCRVNDIPNLKNTDIKWYFVKKDGSPRIPLPNKRWTISTQQIADKTSFIGTDYAKLEDNGYFICIVPTGQESQAELIVDEQPKPFVAKIIPPIINVTQSQRFEFECLTQDRFGNPSGQPILKFLNGSLVSNDKRFKISKVGPSKIRLVAPYGIIHNGENQLQMTCGAKEQFSIVTINIRAICPPYHRYCRSGECIPNQKFCDKVIDCTDGSDEDIAFCNLCDPISKPCGVITPNSTVNQHFNINWACDGESDCFNGFDENHCDTTSKCNTRQFTCNDGEKIPYGYLCDNGADCRTGEDEIGCSKPQIIKTSNLEIRARTGMTVKLRCEVRGYPLPKVTWRYNWNCLPDETRMIIKESSDDCKTIVSELTLNNFKAGDDAIYNCEAVGGVSRALSEPFQVALHD